MGSVIMNSLFAIVFLYREHDPNADETRSYLLSCSFGKSVA
jgi:hypothetical protein